MRTLIVTGANGYIGRHLVDAARDSAWRVVAATRRPVPHADAWIAYRLEEAPSTEGFPDGAVVVHLAASTGAAIDEASEIAAAMRLIEVARTRNARLIFVSSQTAREDAPTPYGRVKWAIERRVVDAGGIVVRPGLVVGGSPGGLYARLLRMSRRRWLPRFVPAPCVQPVHVDDLVRALLALADRHDLLAGTFEIASPDRIAFDAFLRSLAIARFGRPPQFVPVPASVVPLAGLLLRAVGAKATALRLASLRALPAMSPARDLERLGVSLRPLAAALERRHPDRRELVREGGALLGYVLGRPAGLGLRRRYVRALEAARDGRALGLPGPMLAWPVLFGLLDQRAWLRDAAALDERIVLAVTIAEASRQGAAHFLPADEAANPAWVVARLACIGMREAIARIAGFPVRAAMGPRRPRG